MKIYLRPFKETDWEEYLSWHTEKTKWMEYDALGRRMKWN